MAHRPQTSLERKCRWLFGLSLVLLIMAAFIWVDFVSEGLVQKANEQLAASIRLKARNSAQHYLLTLHFENIDTLLHEEAPSQDAHDLFKKMIEQIVQHQHDPNSCTVISANNATSATAPNEFESTEVLPRLKARLLNERPFLEDDRDGVLKLKEEPVFYDTFSSDRQTYYYYQAYRRSRCAPCHVAMDKDIDSDLRLIRVSLPYDNEAETAPTGIRATLTGAGIIAWFVSMTALYLIVRYVIVNPLSHLRDVSDAIRQGNMEARAEINTNDEFQELAESFNRMLRHLTDTQANLKQVNRDLDAKVDELAQLNMQLYEMNRLKSDFLANMSHELRTPLNSIIGFSEVLQGIPALDEKQRRYAGNIQKSGRILLDMINDILDLAKLESGKTHVKPTEFRLSAIVQAQCDMVRSLSEEKNIDLKVQIQRDMPPVFQDQTKLQQILTNLLSNAIKFTPDGGVILVRAEVVDSGDQFELSVSDTGVGIAEEDREIIFEKFRQSNAVLGQDGLTREYSGTGLGLSIVKELCKLLGGEIDFESELGKGSVFRIILPLSCEVRTSTDALRLPHGLADSTDNAEIAPAKW